MAVSSLHPFREWRESLKKPLSRADVIDRLPRSIRLREAYLRQVEHGYYRPSWELAIALAKLTDGKVSADDIRGIGAKRLNREAAKPAKSRVSMR